MVFAALLFVLDSCSAEASVAHYRRLVSSLLADRSGAGPWLYLHSAGEPSVIREVSETNDELGWSARLLAKCMHAWQTYTVVGLLATRHLKVGCLS
jgi:hypothetical protein